MKEGGGTGFTTSTNSSRVRPNQLPTTVTLEKTHIISGRNSQPQPEFEMKVTLPLSVSALQGVCSSKHIKTVLLYTVPSFVTYL